MNEEITSYAEILRKQYGTSMLSKDQVAAELGVSRATIDRMRQEGKIKSKTLGSKSGQVRFSVFDIAKMIA